MPAPRPSQSSVAPAGTQAQAGGGHHPAPHALAPSSFFGSKAGATAGAGAAAVAAGGRVAEQRPAGGAELSQLWVDRYKPRHSAELVGNNTLVANLKQWLQSWEEVRGWDPAADGWRLYNQGGWWMVEG